MKIVLTYDSDQPLNRRCLMEINGETHVVVNFDFKFDYLDNKSLKTHEDVHIGAWGNAKDRKYRESKVVEAIKKEQP